MNTQLQRRHPYPSDVTDTEWAFVAPYLTLMTDDAPQRHHDLREVFNARRWLVRAGAAVYQQTHRWIAAGSFAAIVEDVRLLLRLVQGRNAQLSAAIFDNQTLQSTPESGHRAGYDGHTISRKASSGCCPDTPSVNDVTGMCTPSSDEVCSVYPIGRCQRLV